ncbi:MAG: hypothetical protein LBR76_02265 [Oscillospiraceae bacterium]|jgi:hypothetical protein|nr:hypothetical protein [Oscillospiraceae bacterium]
MTIRSPGREYAALARFCGNKRRLIARARGGGDGLFLLVLADSPQLAKKLTPLLMEYREIAAFTDFVEFFPYENGFCAVFNHPAENGALPLKTVMTAAPPRLRAAALRSLFAALLTQNPPAPVLYDILRPENLTALATGEVRFTYDLTLTNRYADHDARKTRLYLAETVRTICGGREGELTGLLTGQQALHCEELYAAALRDADALDALNPEPEEPPALRARAGALRETVMSRAAPVLAAAAIAAGFIAAAVIFYRAVISPPPPEEPIRMIGTVILEDGAP